MQKLDAVNDCLRAAGVSPINSLDTGDPEAEQATNWVDRLTTTVLLTGWSCNTDFKVVLAQDTSGKVPLPANALAVSARKYNPGIRRVSMRLVSGAKYLWDVANRTFVFTSTVTVDIVYLYDYDALTPDLQEYIAARAAREYQQQRLGAGSVDKFIAEREQKALILLSDAEDEEEDCNVLLDSPFCQQIAGRNSSFWTI